MPTQDPTIKDVMSVVTNLATAVDGLTTTVDSLADAFNTYATHTDSQISRIDNTMTKIQSDMNEMKSGMVTMKSDITTIKSTMVTKSYLDDKIADVKGELITTIRKEDTKVKTVVEKLVTKKIFSNQDKKDIEIMPPFAAIVV